MDLSELTSSRLGIRENEQMLHTGLRKAMVGIRCADPHINEKRASRG